MKNFRPLDISSPDINIGEYPLHDYLTSNGNSEFGTRTLNLHQIS